VSQESVTVSRPLAIAFLACNKNPSRFAEDASWLYRCDNLAWALGQAGHAVCCTHLSLCPPRRFDVVVLHRPRLGWRLRWLLRRWRRQGTRVVADYDDLVFRPECAAGSPAVLNQVWPEAEIAAQFAHHAAALAQVDRVTVSTAPLQAELPLSAAPSWVLPNAVHHSWRGLPATPLAAGEVLSYLPGTRSHDRDFALAAEGLTQFLRTHPSARLELTGPGHYVLDLPASQCQRAARRPFATYPDVVRRARVNLLPLEDTRFNRCKSALKVVEAGFWNIPTLCSPLPDADRFQHAGALVATSPADWAGGLARLMDDAAFYRQHSEGLRERVLARADILAVVAPWLAFVAPEHGHGRG